MKKYEHLKLKAIELRNQGKSLDDICRMLDKSKTTVYYWIKELDVGIDFKHTEKKIQALNNGARVYSNKCKELRDVEYQKGLTDDIKDDVRDFVILYLCEGYRKTKNIVQITNSNVNIIKLSAKVMRKLTDKKIEYNLNFYDDHDELELKNYWAKELSIGQDEIKCWIKNGQGNLRGRNNVSKYGTMQIRLCNTLLKSKIDGWMDNIQNKW